MILVFPEEMYITTLLALYFLRLEHFSQVSSHHLAPSHPHLVSPCCLALLSTAHHKSSSRLVHPNQPSIPSPRLEKSRGGLAREGEFLSNQARLSVQASPKIRKIQKKLLSLDQVSYALSS